jgi:hypothetical protein
MKCQKQWDRRKPSRPKRPAEAKEKTVKEPEPETAGLPKILSPPPERELPKMSKVPTITPKRRRMASVLDAVLESTRVPTPASVEVPSMSEKAAETVTTRAEAEVGASVPTETGPVETVETEQGPSDAALNLENKAHPRRLNLLPPKHLLKS